MGIYIKGLEMPIDDSIRIILHPSGQVIKANAVDYEEFEATSVPPHRRLIDAGELFDYCQNFARELKDSSLPTDIARRNELLAVIGEIIKAPTVIEAESEEE